MALPLANNADGGTSGSAPTTANSGGASGDAFDVVTSGSILTFANDATAHGGLAYKIVQGASNVTSNIEWTASMAASATLWGRVYFRFSSVAPSANTNLVRWLSGATVCANLRLNTAGTIQFANTSNTNVGTASAALSANTWYRIEYTVSFSTTAGAGTANIYLLDATSTTTTTSCTAQNFGATTAGTVRIGNVAVGAVSMTTWMDDLQINATGFPGPAVAAAALPPEVVMAPRIPTY